jgi:polyhydroxybutyrate depolymerase
VEDNVHRFSVGPHERLYELVNPEIARQNGSVPAVVLVHGSTHTRRELAEEANFIALAEENEYLLVLPEVAFANQGWNPHPDIFPPDIEPPSDVAYFDELFSRLVQEHGVDPERIYVAGHISGGMMAYRLAAELPDQVAAIAVVNGTAGIELTEEGRSSVVPNPGKNVPVIAFHSVDNPRIPFWGGTGQREDRAYVSAVRSAMIWAEYNELWPHPVKVTNEADEVVKNLYPSRDGSTEVALYRMQEGESEWPQAVPSFDKTASELIFEFFSRFPRDR